MLSYAKKIIAAAGMLTICSGQFDAFASRSYGGFKYDEVAELNRERGLIITDRFGHTLHMHIDYEAPDWPDTREETDAYPKAITFNGDGQLHYFRSGDWPYPSDSTAKKVAADIAGHPSIGHLVFIAQSAGFIRIYYSSKVPEITKRLEEACLKSEFKNILAKLPDNLYPRYGDVIHRAYFWTPSRTNRVDNNAAEIVTLLELLYNTKAIDGYVLDRIKLKFAEMNLPFREFRITIKEFTTNLAKQLAEIKNKDEFEATIHKEIGQMYTHSNSREEALCHLILELQQSGASCDPDLIIKLCKQITLVETQSYMTAQIIMAEVERAKADYRNEEEVIQSQLSYIESLLPIADTKEAGMQITQATRALYNGNRLSTDLPEELVDLRLTPQSMKGLLSLIKRQKMALDEKDRLLTERK